MPITTKLVKAELLSAKELKWLNDHNADVRKHLEPQIKAAGDEVALAYLLRETAPLSGPCAA